MKTDNLSKLSNVQILGIALLVVGVGVLVYFGMQFYEGLDMYNRGQRMIEDGGALKKLEAKMGYVDPGKETMKKNSIFLFFGLAVGITGLVLLKKGKGDKS